jgi:hypothetical protein
MVPTLVVVSNWQPRVNGWLSDPAGLILRDHLLLSGKTSLKYTQIRLAMIMCSDYPAQRLDRLPRATELRGVRSGF